MPKHIQSEEPRHRPELNGLETLPDGALVIRRTGTAYHGSAFTRIADRLNQNCPEYILGQMALEADYASYDEVEYELRVKPKPKDNPGNR
jgi:hypothetical protein